MGWHQMSSWQKWDFMRRGDKGKLVICRAKDLGTDSLGDYTQKESEHFNQALWEAAAGLAHGTVARMFPEKLTAHIGRCLFKAKILWELLYLACTAFFHSSVCSKGARTTKLISQPICTLLFLEMHTGSNLAFHPLSADRKHSDGLTVHGQQRV